MARRRRRQQSDTGPTTLGLVVLLVLGLYLYQSGIHLGVIIAIFLLSVTTIGLLIYLIYRNKQALLSKSGIATIDTMSGIEFEYYLKALLERRGYSRVKLTTTYDLGVDLIARKDNEMWAIQAKRYKKPVGLDAVRQVIAAAAHYKCTRTMVITNSYFTRNAQTIARSMDCVLIDRDLLIKLILQDNPPK